MGGIIMVIERIGQQFGSYRLMRFLGQGGFAEVYLGEHIHLKTQVAVKVLHTRLIAHQQEQFLREAHTIASLGHPGIIRMLDCGVEHGIPFLIMTYAPHGSLRQLYPEGTRLSSADILSYVRPIASALTYAHEHKLIHRDIKPENILLGARKEVLLSDFGIAVVSSSSSISPDTKEMAGTIAYMAPEQIMGKPRQASDQYALGVVVYEWLCGELPFTGTFLETCTQHLYAPPPSLREKNPDISPALEKVVFKALAKEPEQRFASIQDFADALEECIGPSVPHYYSTIHMPYSSLFTPSAPAFFHRETIKRLLATRRRLLWLYIIGICLIISTLPVFAPALMQRLSTRTPSLISLEAHPYQLPLIRSQVATPVRSRTPHRVQATTLPTSSPTTHVTPAITPTGTPTSPQAKATPEGSTSKLIIPSPVPTTAPPIAPSPTPGSSLQLQVTPGSLAPQVCSERPGYWECSVTLSTAGSDSGRLRWSMALAGNVGDTTTTILRGRLMAGESRPVMIYIPKDPFEGSCTGTSLIFSSSANTVTVPWNCS